MPGQHWLHSNGSVTECMLTGVALHGLTSDVSGMVRHMTFVKETPLIAQFRMSSPKLAPGG